MYNDKNLALELSLGDLLKIRNVKFLYISHSDHKLTFSLIL